MFIEECWSSDAFGATKSAQFGESLIQCTRARTSRSEEIELFPAQWLSFTRQQDAFDGRARRVRFDFEAKQTQLDALILSD